MPFTSPEFFAFVLIVFALYYAPLFKNCQVWLLLAASLVFYASGKPEWLFLLLFSICINSVASWQIMQSNDRKFKLVWSTACIGLNVILLTSFKYSALVASTVARIITLPPSLLSLSELALPVGISFYTFEGISLLVESFKGTNRTEYKLGRVEFLRNTALFFAFFPHLAAGPIVRPRQFYPQIESKAFADIKWRVVFESLTTGYFLKCFVADNLAAQTTPYLRDFYVFNGINSLAALFGFSARIFADFAGYSLIAIGLAAAFGYNLPTNFNFPYRSQSLSEFWTRWHITLSTWIRDYLYIPLGGNRKGTARTYINILLVMFLGGLWHGGKLGFAVWGIYHGIGLCIERAIGLKRAHGRTAVAVFAQIVAVFLFVSAGWLLFAAPLHTVPHFCKALFANSYLTVGKQHLFLIFLFSLPVLLWHLSDFCAEKRAQLARFQSRSKDFVYALMIFLTLSNSGVPQEFFYFQF